MSTCVSNAPLKSDSGIVREHRYRNVIFEVHSHFPEKGRIAADVRFEIGVKNLRDKSALDSYKE